MKIVAINSVSYGSTGNIMFQISEIAKRHSHEVFLYTKAWKGYKTINENHKLIGNYFENGVHVVLSRITGLNGCFAIYGTWKLIKELERINPDIIHLHNLHFWCLNLPMLFKYIKKHNIRTIWTLHDCWTFTGHCPHFALIKCDKWKTGCGKCPQYKKYPESYFDRSKIMFKLKRKWFNGVSDLTLVTPSKWLYDLVKQSYLKEYNAKLIYNGIDLSIFKPTNNNHRNIYKIEHKYVILGVSFNWGIGKGLDVFIELSKKMNEKYQIVLVGTDDDTDKILPESIISIHKTSNQTELAKLYTMADVFVNPTREEVLGLVNIEALACGTPVITFNTGGSPECIDENCGVVVECDDIKTLMLEIIRICEEKPFTAESCVERAKRFDKNIKYNEYIDLYGDLC